jgi:protein SCO1/2
MTDASAGRRPLLPLLLYLAWSALALGWWALALAPLPEASPEWLARTRAVCFGPLQDGLPDGYGFIMLSAPLWLLGALLALWGGDLAAEARARPRLLVILAVLPPLVGLAWVGERVAQGAAARAAINSWEPSAEALPEGYARLDREMPRFQLVDQQGNTITRESLQGRITLLTFAFSHCPAVCPALVGELRQAWAEAAEVDPLLVLVTLDPWRDTPSSLAALADAWQLPRGSLVLSGEVGEVNRALDAFEVPRTRSEQTGEVQHPALVYVVDRQGHLAYAFNNPPAAWLAEAARRADAGR